MSTVQHHFKCCDNDEKAIIGNESAIVVFGSTGTGKSSIIQLFCGQRVKVGHGASSETSQSKIYEEIDSTRYWLDTQGANDSNNIDDDKVLTDILKKLYDEGVTNVKVIWCVSGDLCRMKHEFQIQANFIKSLGNNTNNPFDSCLIIEKQAHTPKPTEKQMKGILAAVKKSNGTIIKSGDVRLFGFTGLDWIHIEDDLHLQDINELYADFPAKKQEKYKRYGYFTSEAIKKELNARLEKLAPLKIQFEMKQCVKCGNKGDPRYIYEKCHVKSEQHHPQSLKSYHPQYGKNVHPRPKLYHPEAFMNTTTTDVIGSVFTLGGLAIGKAVAHEINKKNKNDRGDARLGGYYPCCNKGRGAKGCSYRCCDNKYGSEGCEWQYNCCHRGWNAKGCELKYPCCNGNKHQAGCVKRCSNSACYRNWGTGPGCMRTNK